MLVILKVLMGMFVLCLFPAVDVHMLMGVFVFMGMNEIVMAVRMVMDVRMLVGMLQRNRVFHHENSCNHHDNKTDIKRNRWSFAQNQHTKGSAQKRSDRVVGAGLRRTQIFLCLDVEVNTQPVGHKAQ